MITCSAAETRAIGTELAAYLKAGDVLLLQGDLGAGKSEFARGVARGLGITGPVPSPSFTILNAYDEGTLPLYHFDWYRIEDPAEIDEMGFREILSGDGVSLIEWSENAPEALPRRVLRIQLKYLDEERRELTMTACGGFPLPSSFMEKEDEK